MVLNLRNKWNVDPGHTSINFKIRYLLTAHIRGLFKKFDADICITNNDIATAVIDFRIDAASIDTGNEERDTSLRGADYFDVMAFPEIRFVSTGIGKQNEKGTHELSGVLTIKGITRTVHLEVEFCGVVQDSQGKSRSGFLADGRINRTDWGIIFKSPFKTGGIMAGEEVIVSCEIELCLDEMNKPGPVPLRKADNPYVM